MAARSRPRFAAGKIGKAIGSAIVKGVNKNAIAGDLRVRANKMPDVDVTNRHPALQSMCSKD
jgi:hypothetical protein